MAADLPTTVGEPIRGRLLGTRSTNVSTDVISIFCTACDKLALRWTAAFPKDDRKAVCVYVSRKADVARMDEFIAPKR
jgi:hypothetical protein